MAAFAIGGVVVVVVVSESAFSKTALSRILPTFVGTVLTHLWSRSSLICGAGDVSFVEAVGLHTCGDGPPPHLCARSASTLVGTVLKASRAFLIPASQISRSSSFRPTHQPATAVLNALLAGVDKSVFGSMSRRRVSSFQKFSGKKSLLILSPRRCRP